MTSISTFFFFNFEGFRNPQKFSDWLRPCWPLRPNNWNILSGCIHSFRKLQELLALLFYYGELLQSIHRHSRVLSKQCYFCTDWAIFAAYLTSPWRTCTYGLSSCLKSILSFVFITPARAAVPSCDQKSDGVIGRQIFCALQLANCSNAKALAHDVICTFVRHLSLRSGWLEWVLVNITDVATIESGLPRPDHTHRRCSHYCPDSKHP